MKKRNNTPLWIGVGIAVVGIALLVFLPKKSQAKNRGTIPNPFGGTDDEGFSTSNQGTFSEIGCNGGYTKQGFPLRRGSCGNEVAKLQAFLNSSGGYNLVVDGKFGQLTESAVKEEQSPFTEFKSMYPNAVHGRVSQEYYNDFVA